MWQGGLEKNGIEILLFTVFIVATAIITTIIFTTKGLSYKLMWQITATLNVQRLSVQREYQTNVQHENCATRSRKADRAGHSMKNWSQSDGDVEKAYCTGQERLPGSVFVALDLLLECNGTRCWFLQNLLPGGFVRTEEQRNSSGKGGWTKLHLALFWNNNLPFLCLLLFLQSLSLLWRGFQNKSCVFRFLKSPST